jgi:hypothetical protein
LRRRQPEAETPFWFAGDRFRIGDLDFVCSFEPSTRDLFSICKSRDLIVDTVALLRSLRPNESSRSASRPAAASPSSRSWHDQNGSSRSS